MSLVSCLFTRLQRNSQRVSGGPFRNIRQGFRNQRLDPVGAQSDIVSVLAAHQASAESESLQPDICTWTHLEENEYTAYLFPLPSPPNLSQTEGPSAKPASSAGKVTAAYNTFSNTIRSGAYKSTSPYTVTVNNQRTQQQRNKSAFWTTSTLDIAINGTNHTVYIASISSSSTDTGTPTTLLIHHPTLGTWMTSSVFAPLAYFESLRSADIAEGVSSRQMKAPMPCKVLQVLKKEGEDVKLGEAVIVIESMKMEISIAATAEGKFKCALAVGDTVDEGKELCAIE